MTPSSRDFGLPPTTGNTKHEDEHAKREEKHRITLRRDGGPVVFVGGMNAMLMMYALELKKYGVPVLYIVDYPRSDQLNRPEYHFPALPYPYPSWILELLLPNPVLPSVFRRLTAFLIMRLLQKHSKGTPQAIIVGTFFVSVIPFLNSITHKIFISGGSDLDTWMNKDGAENLARLYQPASIFRFLPRIILRRVIKRVVWNQFYGATRCAAVSYFPRGFNTSGDQIIDTLTRHGIRYVPRYDISFEPLKTKNKCVVNSHEKLILLCPVRFQYKTFPDGNTEYNKGNDIIIHGIARYYKKYPQIEIHFFEKGQDVLSAKQLCDECGLSQVVIWHKTMPLLDLLHLYEKSDVIFDQVGQHWIGAVGFYALGLGKPLIANDERALRAGLWTRNAPIMRAKTPEDIVTRLEELRTSDARRTIGKKSMLFASETVGPSQALFQLFKVE